MSKLRIDEYNKYTSTIDYTNYLACERLKSVITQLFYI